MTKPRVLIKYGGNAMRSDDLKGQIAQKVKNLHDKGFQVILVHGGGPFIDLALKEAGIASEFINGQRYTSKEALFYIERTLKGEVNTSLVSCLNREGLSAIGLSGKDGKIVVAEKRWEVATGNGEQVRTDLGQVGNVKEVHTTLFHLLLSEDFIPVITCIASDENGVDYNINADMFAGHVAAALKVDHYVVLTDVDGLFKDFPDPASLLPQLKLSEIPGLVNSVIRGGMIPKIESCEIALRHGAGRAVVLNGTKPGQIEDYLTGRGQVGTTILK